MYKNDRGVPNSSHRCTGRAARRYMGLVHMGMPKEGGAVGRCPGDGGKLGGEGHDGLPGNSGEPRYACQPHRRGSSSTRGGGGISGGPQEHRQCPSSGHARDWKHPGDIAGAPTIYDLYPMTLVNFV